MDKRWFVDAFDVEANIRWCVECKGKGQRSKVKGLRSKPSAIANSHRYQLSPLAIACSCICRFPLHLTVIIPTFLFPLYFIRRERFVTGRFLHIHTMHKGRKTGDGKGVFTRVASRVHTVGGVSSDTLLQIVLTGNRGCAQGQEGMWLKTSEMYNYTIRLYKYAKLAAWELRKCTRLFFWTKIHNFWV